MGPTMEQIRAAVLANHGGLEGSDDAGIMAVWNALPAEARERYLAQENTEQA